MTSWPLKGNKQAVIERFSHDVTAAKVVYQDNTPIPSSKNPHFQNEAKSTTFFSENEFYLHQNVKSFSYQRLST